MSSWVLPSVLGCGYAALGLWGAVSVSARAGAAASTKAGPSIDEWLSLARASDPQIAPDGRRVAWQLSRIDWQKDRVEDEVWVGAPGEAPQRLAAGASQPRWSPDGRRVGFLADREGRVQVHATSIEGVGPAVVTRAERGVLEFAWSPDGSRIAFTRRAAPDPAVERRTERFGRFEVVGEPAPPVELWVLALEPGEAPAVRASEGAGSVSSFSWSPDGTRLAFAASKGAWSASDVFVFDLGPSRVRPVADRPGFEVTPVWSPDGTRIAYLTSGESWGRPAGRWANAYVAVASAAGGSPRVVSANFDEVPSLLAWTRRGIDFWARRGVDGRLFRVDPDSGAAGQLTPDGATYEEATVSAGGDRAAVLVAHGQSLGEVAVVALPGGSPQRITALDRQLDAFRHSRRELVSWTAPDGTPIEGVLAVPPDFDPGQRYPLLVTLHGGPIDVSVPMLGYDIPYPIEAFVAKGALVLQPNYRGSAGYGESFRRALVGNLGRPQYVDVISGVDALIARGFVDPDRLGAMGWSHGGYLAAFISTNSQRFRAVSVGAGVSDWTTFYTNSDAGTEWPIEYLGATPWADPAAYERTAPLHYLKTARTPTLIQHGERDRRAPLAGAYELFRGLQDHGVPVRMIVYTGAGHAGRSYTPAQYRALLQQNLDWFSTWVWREPADATGAGFASLATAAAAPATPPP